MGGQHLLLYDGTCGLCHRLVRAVLERDGVGVFHFASLQSPVAAELLARLSGGRSLGDTFVVVANHQGHRSALLTKGSAAIFVLKALGWPWKVVAAFGVLPTAALDRAYDVMARHRYRIFGRRDHCVLPTPEHKRRFLDAADDVVVRREVS